VINAAGADLITRSEGIRYKAYFCPAGVPTIGRGHTDGITAQMVHDGYTITPDQERELFQADMEKWERDVLTCLKRQPNENQLAAFVSLAFNIGINGFKNSTVLREFERGNDAAAAAAFALWNKATVNGEKVVLPGLVARRAAEAALFSTSSEPVPQRVDQPSQPETPAMPAPFIFSALPYLLDAIPKLVGVFGKNPEVTARNTKALELVVDVGKQAIGAVNAQDLVEQITSDPAAAATVKAAVEEKWFTIVDIAGVPEARKSDLAFVQSGASPFRSPAFLIAMFLLPLVYMIVGSVVGLFGEPFSPDVRSALANGIVGLILGGIVGFWYGGVAANNNGMRKTDPPAVDR
jgi:lysozyme